MNSWLKEYAYRVDIDAAPFIISTGALLGITILLVAAQSLKAARENPVKSIRTE